MICERCPKPAKKLSKMDFLDLDSCHYEWLCDECIKDVRDYNANLIKSNANPESCLECMEETGIIREEK